VSALRWLLVLPLGVQALAMLVDELYFHRRRGLGAWERIGHPLDTLTVLACMSWVRFVPPSDRAIAVYVGLALASCVFITKDEAVHAGRCSAGEHWLHAVLFVVHPMSLASFGLMWPVIHVPQHALPVWLQSVPAAPIVGMQLVVTGLFCLYQILYWNVPWPRRRSTVP
jgi:hypothetical protein